ncbi:MAG: hypothetical protein HDQ87_05755 [Clostridia bacterium]|nr:hypothetical protein [Clostridia bacterium]
MTARRCSLILSALLCLCAVLNACSSAAPANLPVSASLQSYDSYDELCAAIGYDMVRIGGGGFEPVAYSSIDGIVGQIEYRNEGAELTLRTEPGDEGDITGVGQVTYSISDVNGVDLHVGFFKDIQAAWFVSGDFSYSLTATGMETEVFNGMADQLAHAVTDV